MNYTTIPVARQEIYLSTIRDIYRTNYDCNNVTTSSRNVQCCQVKIHVVIA